CAKGLRVFLKSLQDRTRLFWRGSQRNVFPRPRPRAETKIDRVEANFYKAALFVSRIRDIRDGVVLALYEPTPLPLSAFRCRQILGVGRRIEPSHEIDSDVSLIVEARATLINLNDL